MKMEGAMKRNNPILKTALACLMLPMAGFAHAAATPTTLDVDFTATVIATTCQFVIDTASSTNVEENVKASKYTLTIPNISLNKILSKDVAAQSNFTIKTDACSAGVASITTKISTSGGYSGQLIKNGLSDSTAAANIGMGFKRQSESGENFITPNNSTTLTWSSDEMTNGMPMTVALREVISGDSSTTTGLFDSTATFNFTYN